MRITEAMVEAGAQALRQLEQGGKRLNDWRLVPKSQRQKWLHKAEVVLRAAMEIERT